VGGGGDRGVVREGHMAGSYDPSFYLFAGLVAVALVTSLAMDIRRVRLAASVA